MRKVYKMLRDSTLESQAKAGTYVYDAAGHDYGLANDDTRNYGHEHISVTLNPDGSGPSFTVPTRDIEELLN